MMSALRPLSSRSGLRLEDMVRVWKSHVCSTWGSRSPPGSGYSVEMHRDADVTQSIGDALCCLYHS